MKTVLGVCVSEWVWLWLCVIVIELLFGKFWRSESEGKRTHEVDEWVCRAAALFSGLLSKDEETACKRACASFRTINRQGTCANT